MRFLRFILKVDNLFSLSILVAGAVFVYQMKKILYKQVQSSITSLSIADNLIAHYVNLIVAFPSSYWTEKDYEQFYELYPFFISFFFCFFHSTYFNDYQKYSSIETVKSNAAWTAFFTKQARYHAAACAHFFLTHSYDRNTLTTVTNADFYMYLATSCVSFMIKEQQAQSRLSFSIILIYRRNT